MGEQWTLEELVRRVQAALAASDVRVPNGRVTALPDARVIRWYATIGLVDRPAAMRGRVALYGPRHLLQLVAVKRRQAQGRTLAEIQAELVGATDETLRQVAELPAHELPAHELPAHGLPAHVLPAQSPAPARSRFWAARPASTGAPQRGDATSGTEPGMVTHHDMVYGIALPGGPVLLVASPPTEDDLAAIRSAAQPLVRTLAARGLLNPAGRSPA